MADYISREAMHKANQDEWQGVYGFVDCDIFEDNENMIDRVPAADVRPVVKASWKKDNSYPGPGLMNLRCSVCGGFGGTWKDNTLPSMLYNFCPNCGADMSENKNGQIGEKNRG